MALGAVHCSATPDGEAIGAAESAICTPDDPDCANVVCYRDQDGDGYGTGPYVAMAGGCAAGYAKAPGRLQ
jgi:hypothetical protein